MKTPSSRRRWISRAVGLLSALLLLVGIWLGLLPWLARRPTVANHLNWLREQRIDPSAMYYTELESMEPILDRLNSQIQRRRESRVESRELRVER
jgi:hypothetical protein